MDSDVIIDSIYAGNLSTFIYFQNAKINYFYFWSYFEEPWIFAEFDPWFFFSSKHIIVQSKSIHWQPPRLTHVYSNKYRYT